MASIGIVFVALCVVGILLLTGVIGWGAGLIILGASLYASGILLLFHRLFYSTVPMDLAKLVDSVSRRWDVIEPMYGVERMDDIGDLARSVQQLRNTLEETTESHIQLMQEREHQEFLMQTIDDITFSLLGMPDNDLDMFDRYLLRGIRTVSICGEVDSISVFRNVQAATPLAEWLFVTQLAWDEGIPIVMEEADFSYEYDDIPGWYDSLADGIIINKTISDMSEAERNICKPNSKAILVLPVNFQERFWGIVLYESNKKEVHFIERRIALLRSAALMIVSAVHRKRQAKRIREQTNRMRIMLDAMPVSCYIWDRNMVMIDTNVTGINFFNFKSHEDVIEHFHQTYPEFQPSGQRSSEMAMEYHRRALEEGECQYEWTTKMPDTGELVPCEVRLIRMQYGDRYVVSGYFRDVREHRRMIQEIQHRGYLLYTVNNAANILLQSETHDFESALFRALSLMARAVDVERAFVWEYNSQDDTHYFNQIYECFGDESFFHKHNSRIYYEEESIGFESRLLRGLSISGKVKELPPVLRESLHLENTRSYLMLPIFIRGKLWGLVGFGDMSKEREFSENDESVLRSGGLLVANALLRYEMTQNIKDTATKLQAVISNYSGIIWCVDANEQITLFNGLALNRLEISPSLYEGKRLDDIPAHWHSFDIIENARKTFTEGSQKWTVRLKEYVFSGRTAPVLDSDGRITDVVGSIDDVTESVRLQEQLEKALVEAQSANQAKSNFLANMSHEMRTPMNAILGMSTLGRDAQTIDRKDYSFDRIDAASNHLLGVINDVLDMSKIEAGMLALSDTIFDLNRIIDNVMNVINFRLDEKNQQFSIHIDKDVPQVMVADDQRLAQVLTNLLSNAVKFTPNDKAIRLEIRVITKADDGCVVQFDVIDEGIGLSQEQQKTLFKSFVQAEASTSRKYGGTGLGLAISKHIIDLMGGRIWINSELGRGAVFSFSIKVGLPDKDAIAALQNVVERSGEHYVFPGRRVLLAEDIEINREILIAMLEDSEIEIICAENGVEALSTFAENPESFDLIFMDVHMPKMDGYETTQKIRSLDHPYAKTIPIVAMTANVFREDIEQCLKAGMNGHLGKPIDFDAVKDTLKRYLSPD